MEEKTDSVLPPLPVGDVPSNSSRLWIGNLDTRISELSLIKILQKYGTLGQFDFIYHKTGPDQGKPRGYCFVTYSSQQEAERAKKALDGKLALSRRLVVRDAHAEKKDDIITKKLSMPSATSSKFDPDSAKAKIRAIEAKLRRMDQTDDPPVIPSSSSSRTSSHPPPTNYYQYQDQSKSRSSHKGQGHYRPMPYNKKGSR